MYAWARLQRRGVVGQTFFQENTTCAPAGLALLKEFEDSLARCTSLYTDDQLARLAPQLVRRRRRRCCCCCSYCRRCRGAGWLAARQVELAGLRLAFCFVVGAWG